MHPSSDEDSASSFRRKRRSEGGKPPLPPGSPGRLKAAVPGIDVASLPISPSSSGKTTPRLDPGNAIESRISNYLNSAIERMVRDFTSDLRTILEDNHILNSSLDSFRKDLLANVKTIIKLPEEHVTTKLETDLYEFAKEIRQAEKLLNLMKAKPSPPLLDHAIENMNDIHTNVSRQFDDNTATEINFSQSSGLSRRREIHTLEQKRVLINARIQAIKKQNERLQEELRHIRNIQRMKREAFDDYEDLVDHIRDLRRTIRSVKHGIQNNVKWTRTGEMSEICDGLSSEAFNMCDCFVNLCALYNERDSAIGIALSPRQLKPTVFA